MTLHWDTIKTDDNPQGRTLLGDVWQDIQAKSAKNITPKTRPGEVTSAATLEVMRRSPEEVSYATSIVVESLIRFCALDTLKNGGQYRDTVTNLSGLLTKLTPPRQRPCLPTSASGWGQALHQAEIWLLGKAEIRWVRSSGRSLCCIKRVDS
jgi:hypothetical protein